MPCCACDITLKGCGLARTRRSAHDMTRLAPQSAPNYDVGWQVPPEAAVSVTGLKVHGGAASAWRATCSPSSWSCTAADRLSAAGAQGRGLARAVLPSRHLCTARERT